jgi:hypothetical protein
MTPVNFLWVLLKAMVFKIKPCTVDDLKRSITNETAAIPPYILDANICEHGELCQPDSSGRRKPISISYINQFSSHLPRYVITKFPFISKLLHNLYIKVIFLQVDHPIATFLHFIIFRIAISYS